MSPELEWTLRGRAAICPGEMLADVIVHGTTTDGVLFGTKGDRVVEVPTGAIKGEIDSTHLAHVSDDRFRALAEASAVLSDPRPSAQVLMRLLGVEEAMARRFIADRASPLCTAPSVEDPFVAKAIALVWRDRAGLCLDHGAMQAYAELTEDALRQLKALRYRAPAAASIERFIIERLNRLMRAAPRGPRRPSGTILDLIAAQG